MQPVPLHMLCTDCDGHGRLPERPGAPRSKVCPACRGKGLVPTQEGRAIIGLLGIVGLEELTPEG